jgi:hypothetical protein
MLHLSGLIKCALNPVQDEGRSWCHLLLHSAMRALFGALTVRSVLLTAGSSPCEGYPPWRVIEVDGVFRFAGFHHAPALCENDLTLFLEWIVWLDYTQADMAVKQI